jgi:hypothetical protein
MSRVTSSSACWTATSPHLLKSPPPSVSDGGLIEDGDLSADRADHRRSPLAALDCPQVLIWDDAGQTKVSDYGPAALAARYGLSADLAAIDPITDALIAP